MPRFDAIGPIYGGCSGYGDWIRSLQMTGRYCVATISDGVFIVDLCFSIVLAVERDEV